MPATISILESYNGESIAELELKADLKVSELLKSVPEETYFAVSDKENLKYLADITILDDRFDILVNFDEFNWFEYFSIQGKLVNSKNEISLITGRNVVIQSNVKDDKPDDEDVLVRSNLYYEELVFFIPMSSETTFGYIYSTALQFQKLISAIVAEVVLISKSITNFKKPKYLNWNIKLFISHSSKDKIFVRKIANALKKNKLQRFDVWFDEDSILVGHDFIEQIEKGIKESDFLILVISKNFVENGPWAKEEYRIALTEQVALNKTKILPILIEDCSIPLFLKSKHYADFRTDFKFGLNKLINSIKKLP